MPHRATRTGGSRKRKVMSRQLHGAPLRGSKELETALRSSLEPLANEGSLSASPRSHRSVDPVLDEHGP